MYTYSFFSPCKSGLFFIIQYFCAASCSRIKGFGLIIYNFTVDSPMMSAWKHLLFLCVCAKSRILNFVVHKQHINVVTGRNFAHLLFTQKVWDHVFFFFLFFWLKPYMQNQIIRQNPGFKRYVFHWLTYQYARHGKSPCRYATIET